MQLHDIKVIIGLGNPGPAYKKTRHNIGFLIVDALAERCNGQWQHKDLYDIAHVDIGGHQIMLIKPLTFMNNVGKIIPMLTKKGIMPSQILVIHDELEKSLGTLQTRLGGSARGHNGLRSIISAIGASQAKPCAAGAKTGEDFHRLRFGIGRPVHKEDVADWVLSNFEVDYQKLQDQINKAVDLILSCIV